MNESQMLETLLEELEFEFEDDNICCLYQFAWFLNQYRGSISEDQIRHICHLAYAEISRRHPLKLVWVDWPSVDPDLARDADPDTPLDFEISATGEVKSPLQALVRLD